MPTVFSKLRTTLRIDRWMWITLVCVPLGLAGCCSMDHFRGEGFNDDSGQAFGAVRKPDRDIEFWGFSNKSREIERNLGASE
jgi:hypothetical protein